MFCVLLMNECLAFLCPFSTNKVPPPSEKPAASRTFIITFIITENDAGFVTIGKNLALVNILILLINITS